MYRLPGANFPCHLVPTPTIVRLTSWPGTVGSFARSRPSMRGCVLPAPINLMSEKQSPHASTRAIRSSSVQRGNGTVSGFPSVPRLARPVPFRRHESMVAGIGYRNCMVGISFAFGDR